MYLCTVFFFFFNQTIVKTDVFRDSNTFKANHKGVLTIHDRYSRCGVPLKGQFTQIINIYIFIQVVRYLSQISGTCTMEVNSFSL